MVSLAASIICGNQLDLKTELQNLKEAGIDMLHCDVMDGIFVNNLALGPDVLAQIRRFSDIPLDIHLATIEPEKYIKMFLPIKPKYLSFHIETTEKPQLLINLIKENQVGAAVAVSPETELVKVVPLLKELDMLLIMTVNPGFAGQNFNYKVLNKLKELKDLCKKLRIQPVVEVDGCLNKTTIPLVVKEGANLLVLGTAGLFKGSCQYSQTVKQLLEHIGDT